MIERNSDFISSLLSRGRFLAFVWCFGGDRNTFAFIVGASLQINALIKLRVEISEALRLKGISSKANRLQRTWRLSYGVAKTPVILGNNITSLYKQTLFMMKIWLTEATVWAANNSVWNNFFFNAFLSSSLITSLVITDRYAMWKPFHQDRSLNVRR